MGLCIHPRVNADSGSSLTSFISISCCHIGALPSLLMLSFPCARRLSGAVCGRWLTQVKVSFNHRELGTALPCQVLGAVASLSCFLSILPPLSNSLLSYSDGQRKQVRSLPEQMSNLETKTPSLFVLQSQFQGVIISLEPPSSLGLRWGWEAPLPFTGGLLGYFPTQALHPT